MSIPPGVLEALLPRQNRPKPTPLASFSGGVQDVTTADSDVLYNKYDLLCPRPECGSIILLSSVGKLLERPSVTMEPADKTPSQLPSLPEPPANTEWWLITPSPMEFENIGFSKPVDLLSSQDGKQLKLLLCAQCDLGPLGWCEVGGTEFWLSCSRVGYRVD
ncbi:Mss4-like protein [Roridomyces roridus]|uniref:Mss4-like protein n=1 Tax=Roridomyces roridus TaxID=1738132 RepID=A0AAD7BTB8_9AGAR|nr:Mss4-like protein [Roridomyces roridus]